MRAACSREKDDHSAIANYRGAEDRGALNSEGGKIGMRKSEMRMKVERQK